MNRVTLHPIGQAACFDRGDHIARRRRIKTRIKQRIAWCGHAARQHRHDDQQGQGPPHQDAAAAPIQPVPKACERVHHGPRIHAILACPSGPICRAIKIRLVQRR
jgi:hypothetical protein